MDGLGVITTLSPTILPLLSERLFMTEQERPEEQKSIAPPKAKKKTKRTTKKTTKKTTQAPIRQKSATADSLIGATLSLNFEVRGFFGIGDFLLTASEPTAVVSKNIEPQEELVIRNAIAGGALVYGDKPKPGIVKHAPTLEKYTDAIKTARMVNRDLHPVVNELARKRQDGNFTVHEVLDHMLQYEVEHENRQAFVDYLNYAMSRIPGPTKVTWTPPKANNNASSSPAAPPSLGYQSEAKGML